MDEDLKEIILNEDKALDIEFIAVSIFSIFIAISLFYIYYVIWIN